MLDADLAQRADHEVAPARVDRAHLAHGVLRPGERLGAGQLDRLEQARVDVRLQPPVRARSRRHCPTIAAQRQPVMFHPFESENTSTPTSIAPGVARKLGAT